MAKPRVFVSSTYYDLRFIRDGLRSFIEGIGYEPVLFENGDIPFRHDQELDKSCYAEVRTCQMLVLIIGGRYGTPASGQEKPTTDQEKRADQFYESITKQEYFSARERGTPLFIFVSSDVLHEHRTYLANVGNSKVKYASVDSVGVFRLLDEIKAQPINNFIRPFDRLDDITSWLRDQWAGLFSDYLSERSTEKSLKDLSDRIADLEQLNKTLKSYAETIIQKMAPDSATAIIDEQDKRAADIYLYRRFQTHACQDPWFAGICAAFSIDDDPKVAFEALKTSETLGTFASVISNREIHDQDFTPEARDKYKRLREKVMNLRDYID